jgi:DNA-binding response OmpR family regulator
VARLSYESAETLIYDPVSANRNTTRTSLYTLGFRRIETVASIDAFFDAIKKRPPDLAFCEAQGADEELCKAIQSLRQGAGSDNPFLVIIVTAWEKSTALVRRVVNSGADDLVLRPFSTAQLGARILSHVERRKGFVITTEYVGPDRRNDPDRSTNVELFQPPNSLQMKAKERLGADEISKKLELQLTQARATLNSEKLRRDAFQICVQWRLLQQFAASADISADLSKLADLTRQVEQRCGDTSETGAQGCSTILNAIDTLELGGDRVAPLKLLGHAAIELLHAFAPEKSASGHLAEVDATVAIIRARTQTQLAC